jgi:hypothetical protein
VALKIFDPLLAAETLGKQKDAELLLEPATQPVPSKPQVLPAGGLYAPSEPQETLVPLNEDQNPQARIKADFRLFLILLWRHLLGKDPAPSMLDMAGYLQHGPVRSVINAFRGFSKSWITGGYALWRLYVDAQQKILIVSGSLTRALATAQWCLSLIQTWPLLRHLKPGPHQRQSGKAFDVGPALPDQSPSVHALGIGGQIVGFRGDCIIPDDVETQQNSITVAGREAISEAVKEFDSVLKPPILNADGTPVLGVLQPAIKYLGTPHDEDSLYGAKRLLARGYSKRIWPATYPDPKQLKAYGDHIAPWVVSMLEKDAKLVGTPIMPTRFSMDDLTKRRLSLGNSEYALQYMLDTSLADANKYPLKVRDLMVMSLDPRRGPEQVTWTNDLKYRLTDLPVMGFPGDFFYEPALPPDTVYIPWNRIVAAIDNSGRGQDETSLCIGAELNGVIFLLKLYATKAGYDIGTLQKIAELLVQYRVQKVKIESNFGDGMFAALLTPVIEAEWKKHFKTSNRGPGWDKEGSGTLIEEVRSSNQMAKEKRILAIMEPVTQQHRLVIAKEVIEYDYASLKEIEGEDTRYRYALGHQYTHLTREKDSLVHDDRLDSLAILVSDFADILGVDPSLMAASSSADRMQEEFDKLYGDLDEDDDGMPRITPRGKGRAAGLQPTKR